MLILFCGLELALSIYNRYFTNTTGSKVSYAGHAVRVVVFTNVDRNK